MAATMLAAVLPEDAVALDLPVQGAAPGRRAGAGLDGWTVEDVDRHERLTAMREGRLGSVHSWEP